MHTNERRVSFPISFTPHTMFSSPPPQKSFLTLAITIIIGAQEQQHRVSGKNPARAGADFAAHTVRVGVGK